MFHGGHRIPAESFDILIQFLVGVFQEMFHVSRQVAVPFPQGRHSQHEFIKSVVQVFPKPSGRNGRFEIFVGGNDDAYVDSDIVGCADRAYLTLLQGAQQLYLYVVGKIAYFIEKYGTSVRYFEYPFLVGDSRCECSFQVAEQFAGGKLRERLPQSTAMKGAALRGLYSCIMWAACSLPVPLSPTMRTDMFVGATIRM